MITFTPWHIRGHTGKVWQVYAENLSSHDLSELIKAKQLLNNPPVKGVLVVENKSPAMKRLGPGWKELEYGVWYKVFS